MILLFVASICTSTVSALLIQTPQQIQPPGTEPDLDPTLSNTTINRGTINDSLLSTPTNNLLDQGHNTSLSKLNLSVEPSYNCDEGRESDLLTLRMCAEALASVPWVIGPERRSISFGPREAHVFDIGLPRRFMSCEFSSS